MKEIKKVVLAYSGGLDTSIIIPWLKENYNNCEVVAVSADVGQGTELDGLEEKALKTGASKLYIEDLKKEFVEDYIFPTLKAGAVYERDYLLGTSFARPIIAKRLVEIAKAEGADAIAQSFREKKYISTDSVSTIADGIAVKAPGDITVELINRYADDVVTVNDNEISEAILLLMERCKQIVEPSGATPVAAVLKGKVDVKGKKVVCLLSGGNIDVSFIQCIIAQGLVARNRRLKFTATLLDKPGSLVKLLNAIAAQGANILTVEHDRLSAGLTPNQTNVHIACEVGGKEHGERLLRALGDKGFKISLNY